LWQRRQGAQVQRWFRHLLWSVHLENANDLVRNEGEVDVVLITVQLFPADSGARGIDFEGLGICSF
jgi:hypothetical protein